MKIENDCKNLKFTFLAENKDEKGKGTKYYFQHLSKLKLVWAATKKTGLCLVT